MFPLLLGNACQSMGSPVLHYEEEEKNSEKNEVNSINRLLIKANTASICMCTYTFAELSHPFSKHFLFLVCISSFSPRISYRTLAMCVALRQQLIRNCDKE